MIFSLIFHKTLEEWKKIGKKFRRPSKNSGKVGRMEEALEEENNSKLQKIFSFIFQKNIGRMEKARQKNSPDLAKTLKMLEEWKKL